MNKKLISAVHNLDRLSHHHTVTMSPAEARAFALHADSHPQPAEELRAMLKELDAAMPKMDFGMLNGRPNPNNGRMAHRYKIGKEYSRVVYLETAKRSYRQKIDWATIGKKLCAIGKKYGVDESDIVEDDEHGFTIRFWWD
jgi:hypothetical protein